MVYRRKKIKFELVKFEKNHIIVADRQRISQVISNSVNNSVNFLLDSKKE